MTSLKESIYKGLLQDFNINSPHNINEQCGKVAENIIKELEQSMNNYKQHQFHDAAPLPEITGMRKMRDEVLRVLRDERI